MIKAAISMFTLGLILGIILAFALKIFYVKVDERYEKVLKMLPGYNCGACGFPGCSGMAKALLDKKTDTLSCKPSKPVQRQAIVNYLNSTPDLNGELLNVKSI